MPFEFLTFPPECYWLINRNAFIAIAESVIRYIFKGNKTIDSSTKILLIIVPNCNCMQISNCKIVKNKTEIIMKKLDHFCLTKEKLEINGLNDNEL